MTEIKKLANAKTITIILLLISLGCDTVLGIVLGYEQKRRAGKRSEKNGGLKKKKLEENA